MMMNQKSENFDQQGRFGGFAWSFICKEQIKIIIIDKQIFRTQ